ncbi:DUF1775 domain-containing protein [Streptomyces sp. NPDC059928]|uniref:DUF1775 domain-containing protein n=1 Tax=unclassified Streptomyces TaxID=2593676 RepID=UPI0036620617
MTFKAVQTYSDGKVVRWIDTSTPGQEEPANPAPVLHLTAAQTASRPASSAAPGSAKKTTASASSSDSTARGLGIAGLVVGALGLAAAAIAIRNVRRARG